MTISTLNQTIEVTDVGQVIITEITQDDSTQKWIREIRIYSEASADVRTLLFTLRLEAAEEDYIEMTAPSQLF